MFTLSITIAVPVFHEIVVSTDTFFATVTSRPFNVKEKTYDKHLNLRNNEQ